jgi:hypothetical protein
LFIAFQIIVTWEGTALGRISLSHQYPIKICPAKELERTSAVPGISANAPFQLSLRSGACRTGAGEKPVDFAELLAQPRLSGILSGHGAWAPSYRQQWRQVVIAIPARRMQQDRLQAGHTIPPSRSVRQASERPPCCHKESAVAYLLLILAEREPVERQRRQLYVSETSSSAMSIEAQLIP